MPNMQQEKTKMPEQDAGTRSRNFLEVSLGYTAEQAQNEAGRCLNCKARPCVDGCPVNVPIPDFIAKLQEGDVHGAAEVIATTNFLPAICGRVCPQESQCEKYCVRGKKGEAVAIGRLERYTADTAPVTSFEKAAPNGKKAAVVGSGPSGLTCAGGLARAGYDVTVFEALHKAGGVLIYGIPEFRLPKAIVSTEIDKLKSLGVTFKTNIIIGKTLTLDELFEQGFAAVYIGSGAGLPNFLNVPGEDANGVYSANEFLTRVNLMKAYEPNSRTPILHPKRTVVFGGGNVAMDAARCAKRLGSNVTIAYRRTENELPARLEEIHHAKEEGIEFHFLAAPLEITQDDDGWVTGVKFQQMKLGEPDASGRARPVPVEGEDFVIDADCAIVAIGNSPNPLISSTTKGLETNKHGCLVLSDEPKCQTTRENVYAGGDAVTGAATVILAMGAGRAAAAAINS